MQFKDIVGHKEVKQRLITAVKEGRVSHSLLFLGNEGSGNLPMAIAFAQYINCKNKSDSDSCGICDSCRKITNLQHPDLLFSFPVNTNNDVKKNPVSKLFYHHWRDLILEQPYFSLDDWQIKLGLENKQLNISKDESTEIIKALNFSAYEAEYKVMIIWYPEKMHTSAANALLKILEEPPQKTIFILVAHNSEQLLATILSRTQLVKFPPLSLQELAQYLQEHHSINTATAEKFAKISNGNYLSALRLIDAEQYQRQDEFFELFVTWMRLAFKADVPGLIAWVDELNGLGRETIKSFLQYALHIIRESLAVNYAGSEATRLTDKEENFIKNFAPFLLSNNLPAFLTELSETAYHIERNVNPKVVMLDISFKITKILRVNKVKK